MKSPKSAECRRDCWNIRQRRQVVLDHTGYRLLRRCWRWVQQETQETARHPRPGGMCVAAQRRADAPLIGPQLEDKPPVFREYPKFDAEMEAS